MKKKGRASGHMHRLWATHQDPPVSEKLKKKE